MAQYDFGTIDPATKTGTTLASDLNQFRDALNSGHAGSTRPSYAVAGTEWINNSTNPWIINRFDGTDDIPIGTINTSTNTFTPSIVADIQKQSFTRFSAGGTADAITGSLSPAITSYIAGLRLTTTPLGANTVTTPTINVNTIGTKTIKKKDISGSKVALNTGDYNQSGPFDFEYDGTDFVLLNPLQNGISFASAAENAAGIIENKAVDPLGIREAFNATGSAPVYACRAWVNFNGTGTPAIRASGNVSSITDNGAGDYTLNFSTAISDTNYGVSMGGTTAGGRVTQIKNTSLADTTPILMTTTQIRIFHTDANTFPGSPQDLVTQCVSIFR